MVCAWAAWVYASVTRGPAVYSKEGTNTKKPGMTYTPGRVRRCDRRTQEARARGTPMV